jgi:hypothetical protein
MEKIFTNQDQAKKTLILENESEKLDLNLSKELDCKQSLLSNLNYRHQMFADKFLDIYYRLNEVTAQLGGVYEFGEYEDDVPTNNTQSQISIYEHILQRNEINLAKIYKITERLEQCVKF